MCGASPTSLKVQRAIERIDPSTILGTFTRILTCCAMLSPFGFAPSHGWGSDPAIACYVLLGGLAPLQLTAMGRSRFSGSLKDMLYLVCSSVLHASLPLIRLNTCKSIQSSCHNPTNQSRSNLAPGCQAWKCCHCWRHFPRHSSSRNRVFADNERPPLQ
jgi:hypothetical protein